MRAAQVENGVVKNVIEVDSLNAFPGLIDASIGGNIGDHVVDGAIIAKASVTQPSISDYTKAMQGLLDSTAQAHGYDGILSACTYAESVVPRFHAEGQACFAWRDSVWAAGDLLLKSVQSGQMQAPTIPALIAMLPKMEWPNV